MDFSSLPEDQQKQLHQIQQLHQHLQEHQPQPQPYDPSHAQPYDPSYYAYQSHHYSQPPQHQNYDSYHHHQADYANAHLQHNSQGVPAGEVQNPAGYGANLGLNPAAAAAVAALTQLAQFAGNMEAAEKAIALVARGGGYGQTADLGGQMQHGPPFQSPGGQSPYRGGGRRGGRPFRGSSRGTSFNRGGRGRGRGAPRRSPPDGAASASSSQPKPSADAAEMSTEGAEEKAEVSETTQIPPVLKQGNPIPNKQPPPQAARCELCQIECNSLAILETHKNGKKHKKNLQKAGKAVPETDSIPQVTSHPETVQEGKVEQILQQETLTTESVDIGSNVGALQQNDNSEVPVLPVADQSNVPEAAASGSSDQRHGTKRKMRGGGRGGKRVKPVDTAKPSKPPKVVIPLICDLCNVRCDTQEVFDKHLAGKKHISKLKRFEGHQAMYGPSGLQALYPPNPIAQTMLAPPQGPPQQYVYDAQVSLPPPEPYVPPQPHYSAPASVFQPTIGNH